MASSDSKEHPLAMLPMMVTLANARQEPNTDESWIDGAEKIVVVIAFSEPNFGFGQITMVQEKGKLVVDSEYMGREKVMTYLKAMIDAATFDTDESSEKVQ